MPIQMARSTLVPMSILLARIMIACVFLWAALQKAFIPPKPGSIFDAFHSRYPTGAAVLILTEIALAVWLLYGARLRLAALSTLFALAVFMAVAVSELTTGHPRTCGCGIASVAADIKDARGDLIITLFRNGVLTVLSMAIYLKAETRTFAIEARRTAVQ